MAEIIARFADGRLLVQEDRAVETGAVSGGYASLRVGHIKTIEKVLSIDAHFSGCPGERLATELRDVVVSGDTLRVLLRRMDLGLLVVTSAALVDTGPLSGFAFQQGIFSGLAIGGISSGGMALSRLSGVTSGIGYYEPICSTALISGAVQVLANVIGY